MPFQCHRCHSTKHLVAQCDHPFYGKRRSAGRKERAREEVLFTKKAKGPLDDMGISTSAAAQVHTDVGFIPRVIHISVASICGLEGFGLNDGSLLARLTDATMPSSSMDFSNPSSLSSAPSKDSIFSMIGVRIYCNNPSPNGMHFPWKVSCSIALFHNAFLDPLVTPCTTKSLSSEDSKILYALRSKVVLLDSPTRLGIL